MIALAEDSELLASRFESADLPPGVTAEFTQLLSSSRSVGWAEGKPSLSEASNTGGLCVRVLEKNRHGMVALRSTDPEKVRQGCRRALTIARATPEDPYRQFSKGALKYPPRIGMASNFFTRPLTEIQDQFATWERRILSMDKRLKKIIKLQYDEHISKKILVNSNGVKLMDESSAVSVAAEVLAEDKEESEVAWDYRGHRFIEGLTVDDMLESLGRHAVSALGGKPLSSGKYPVVVSARVGAQLLGLVANALSAEADQRGRSFLSGKQDQPVASSLVTLTDDPFLSGGVASAPFDDEGTPHERVSPISQGVLKDYFHDIRSAAKDGRRSNGHGMKQTLGSLPRPAQTNFYLEPGNSSLDQLLHSHPRVFLLRDVMGLHMADPITGEFSLGAAGLLYKNGELDRSVRGVTIAGTIAGLLKDIGSIGNDLTWYGATGSPSFLIPQVTIAGN